MSPRKGQLHASPCCTPPPPPHAQPPTLESLGACALSGGNGGAVFKEELSRGGPGDLWQSRPMKKVFLALVRKSVWSLAGWLPSDSSRYEHFWVLFVPPPTVFISSIFKLKLAKMYTKKNLIKYVHILKLTYKLQMCFEIYVSST